MNPFSKPSGKLSYTTAGRAPVIAVALLFLVTVLLSALPSREEIFAILEESALAGYATPAETTPRRPSVLGEYYDTPVLPTVTDEETAPESEPSPQPIIPAGSEAAKL